MTVALIKYQCDCFALRKLSNEFRNRSDDIRNVTHKLYSNYSRLDVKVIIKYNYIYTQAHNWHTGLISLCVTHVL